MSAAMDHRAGRPRRKRIALRTIREMCRLTRGSIRTFPSGHFYEHLTQRHGVAASYTFTRVVLQEAGIVENEPSRGRYRRERRRGHDGDANPESTVRTRSRSKERKAVFLRKIPE